MPSALLIGLAAILVGGVAAAASRMIPSARWSFAPLVVIGCVLVAVSASATLAGGEPWELTWRTALPGGDWSLGVDPLTAMFLLAIAIVGAAATVYGTGYLSDGRAGAVAFAHSAVAVLIVALALVVTARAAVPFLIAWEIMALAAFVLVMFEWELDTTRQAGLLYLAATHTATLALIALFALWGAGTRDLSFAALAEAGAGPQTFDRRAVLLLALVGFGLKAGVVPLHFWLPSAHAAAPSHVSALMSGLVIKTGIYGLLRVAALLGGLPEWYGWTVLALGLLSGILGVVWALAQHDMKRLLAYHSVENIGIILIGMGVGALGTSYQLPAVAVLGYAGAILHVLNHALFKSLLFLGAGSIARGAGSRSMDRLGGLARRMPVTALAFLVGSVAIVGLPPLNGFVSEWIIALALVGSAAGPGAVRAAIFAIAGLGLTGGLALACFVKVNGVVFLGRPRSAGAAEARECDALSGGPMIALALACGIIGLLPALVLPPALKAAAVVSGTAVHAAGSIQAAAGTLSIVAIVFAAAVGAGWLAYRHLMRGRWRTVRHVWSGGFPQPTSRMQYTASSFAAPVLEPFGPVAGQRTTSTASSFESRAVDPVLDAVLLPAWGRLRKAASRLGFAQVGRLHVSLLYVLATVIVLLGYLAL